MADFLCLDLAEDQIRIADIIRNNNLFDAINLGILEMDPSFYRTDSEKTIEKIATSISKALDQLKIKKKGANVIIPDSFSYNRFIEMPKLNEKELMSAIRYQADQFIPMPLEDVNLDIEVVDENVGGNKTLVLLSASAKTVIEKVKKLVEYAGLLPNSIEPETSAIGRFFSQTYKKNQTKTTKNAVLSGFILINLNFSSTSVYYFNQELNLMTYNHNFATGYNLFLKEIQVNLNVDVKKAAELLKNFGLSPNSSYHLESILTPSLKELLTKIDGSIKEIIGKNKSQIANIFLVNDALKFNSLETIIGKFFGIPASFFNLSPYFVKNKVVDFYKNDLTYFLASAGGSLQ